MSAKLKGEPFPVSVTVSKARLTPQFRRMCEEKLHSLQCIFKHVEGASIAIRSERGFFISEITVLVSGFKMRSEERAKSMRVAFEAAFDALKEQLRRYKEKLYDRHKRSNEEARNLGSATKAQQSQIHGVKIKRIKRFESKPMRVDEAALQMELLGHDFFVFINAETERVSVLYRRRDGSYGMIELI